jgi:hypothetical protein
MRHIHILGILSVLTFGQPAAAAAQDHVATDKHGASVMGFDQGRTTHRFSLLRDGGQIEVSVNDPSDVKNRDAIRSHLPHIATMFGEGNFNAPMLVHDSSNVPGTKLMTSRKQRIRYEYVETPRGGRVNIVTTDPDALKAVHQFLRFQIKEHKTGDSTAVQSR